MRREGTFGTYNEQAVVSTCHCKVSMRSPFGEMFVIGFIELLQ